MKNLPIGVQAFSKIREKNCVYVDKTPLIHQLVTTGNVYFLSRPRRFGKSLLVSTMKELFLGNKALFEGLWIENRWDWTQKSPIIHISFDAVDYDGLGLDAALKIVLKKHADSYNISLEHTTLKLQFKELIEKLAENYGQVVLLIDEYDKPIIDYLEKNRIERAQDNRLIMREFYSVLKNADELLRLIFITGISKFSKVSLFSHLNNLDDITLSERYGTLVGYTETELKHYFAEHLTATAKQLKISEDILIDTMRVWYNGYSWDGENRLYNPFGTLRFFANQKFQNHWFATGSPNFLIHQMRQYNRFDVENIKINSVLFEKFDIENIELVSLLFQTGYLTVKESDSMTGDLVLDYPNKEVRESMYQFLIDDLAFNVYRTNTGLTIRELTEAFVRRDLVQVRKTINSILADLPAQTFSKQTEGLYHGLIHLIFSYLGQYMQSEVHSSQGRADAVVQTLTDVFIFEFKFNRTAKAAMKQIKDKDYAGKHRASNKIITGIGVNFKTDKRVIDGWLEEVL